MPYYTAYGMHACLQVGADLVGAYRKQSLDPDRLGVVTGLATGLDATLEVSQPASLCTALVQMRSTVSPLSQAASVQPSSVGLGASHA
jgi:hypothetical protein